MSKKTPLYEVHVDLGAKMVDFGDWLMPLHYGSQLKEHHIVRQSAGIFDVSHMTVVDVLGPGSRDYLRYLLANDVDKLKSRGQALYTCMLNNDGGVLDDLIVYFIDVQHYRLVLNASTRDHDLKWMNKIAHDFSVGLHERQDLAMLAIQGPEAIKKVQQLLSPMQLDASSTLQPFEFVDSEGLFIARTGYTGEEGYEIILANDKVCGLWQDLLSIGVMPCGLGARDTLRLEAGLNLYGQDMDKTTTPLESNLAWTVAFDPEDRLYIGRAALELQKTQGVTRKLVGLVLKEQGIARAHQQVFFANGTSGEITSGTFSPTLELGIALARIPSNAEGDCFVEIRHKRIPAQIVKPPFIRRGKKNFI